MRRQMRRSPRQLAACGLEFTATLVWCVTALVATRLSGQTWPLSVDRPFLRSWNTTFDLNRGRVVVFGVDGELSEFDGLRSLRRAPVIDLWRPVAARRPVPRSGALFIHDPVRDHLLLYGGANPADPVIPYLGDTWIHDGVGWTRQTQLSGPGGRAGISGTFDSLRGRVVMFGGVGLHNLDDTWEHDGANWLPTSPATRPPPGPHPMTFDTFRGVTVMAVQSSPPLVFEWNGVDWVQRSAPVTPPALIWPSLVFDLVRGRSVLVGDSFQQTSDIWEWDGNQWLQTGNTPVPGIGDAASWFDPAHGAVVFAGGTSVHAARFDWWSFDGTSTALLHDERRPRYGDVTASFWDSRRDELMVIESPTNIRTVAGHYLRRRDGWVVASSGPGAEPGGRMQAAACYDSVRGRGLLFGGHDGAGELSDTWSWDGAAWTQHNVAGPPARYGAAMAFDSARGVAVLFGGSSNDTWEWNGAAWTRRLPAQSPPARYSGKLAYDERRQRTVLAGGYWLPSPGVDVWEWDGTDWTQVLPAGVSPDWLHWMVYDASVGLCVASGMQPQTSGLQQEHFTYDGVQWRSIRTTFSRTGQLSAPTEINAAAYDPRRQRILEFYEYGLREWSPANAVVEHVASGCGNPAPQLVPRTRPRIGNPEFGLEVRASPGGLSIFGLAATSMSVPLPGGCTLALGPAPTTSVGVASSRGIATQLIALPLLTSLRSVRLFAQAATLDPVHGLRLTNAIAFTVGD